MDVTTYFARAVSYERNNMLMKSSTVRLEVNIQPFCNKLGM